MSKTPKTSLKSNDLSILLPPPIPKSSSRSREKKNTKKSKKYSQTRVKSDIITDKKMRIPNPDSKKSEIIIFIDGHGKDLLANLNTKYKDKVLIHTLAGKGNSTFTRYTTFEDTAENIGISNKSPRLIHIDELGKYLVNNILTKNKLISSVLTELTTNFEKGCVFKNEKNEEINYDMKSVCNAKLQTIEKNKINNERINSLNEELRQLYIDSKVMERLNNIENSNDTEPPYQKIPLINIEDTTEYKKILKDCNNNFIAKTRVIECDREYFIDTNDTTAYNMIGVIDIRYPKNITQIEEINDAENGINFKIQNDF